MLKSTNEYQLCFPEFAKTPKSVIAAIAMSFALRLCDGELDQAKQLISDEWSLLHQNKIVPQKRSN